MKKFTKTQKCIEYQNRERKEFNGKLVDFLREQILTNKIKPEALEAPLPEQLKILQGHTKEECIILLDSLGELREYARKRRKHMLYFSSPKGKAYNRRKSKEYYLKDHPNAGHMEVYARVYRYLRKEYFKKRYHKKHPNAEYLKSHLTKRVLFRNGKPVKPISKCWVPLGTEKPLIFNKCLNCGKETPYKKFCSRECLISTQNKNRVIGELRI